ncbi:phosphate ABC transporter permease subunit PstC [Actinoplanes sp. TBRC 11911]|uniref:phosphate ABC transporter permease subunit PstC n=1 Tax=Actinoplanes sp. TBRC 11911 TaxID=2729386 RepID=UPI00145DA1C6|nr:phosphate ABC transporter permease subunit PstC [Actinoplanes sp. TBRC 11911]NMO51193.1 phosphate ABC transporter permease subunit PstC [Actinoplanes sp. TBRC 11911]
MSDVLVEAPERQGPQPRVRLKANLEWPDRVFRGVARGGGLLVLLIMALVGTFLTYRALQALRQAGFSFVTTQDWNPDGGGFGIAAVMVGTVLIAIVAIVVATALAVGVALYISEMAPPGVRRLMVALVDLMAAVPSVVYGLWGAYFLQWRVLGLSRWISDWFGWIPLFKVSGVQRHDPLTPETLYTSSTFIAGLVVALMVAPIACSVMREAFSQAPPGEREGAYALGATRWGMIRSVVLPFGRGALIGGIMLGLGRALGETIAVVLIISPVFKIQPHIFENGTSSVSSLIALHYGESSPFALSALMAAGLALFALTLLVNFAAASIVARSRSGAVSEA